MKVFPKYRFFVIVNSLMALYVLFYTCSLVSFIFSLDRSNTTVSVAVGIWGLFAALINFKVVPYRLLGVKLVKRLGGDTALMVAFSFASVALLLCAGKQVGDLSGHDGSLLGSYLGLTLLMIPLLALWAFVNVVLVEVMKELHDKIGSFNVGLHVDCPIDSIKKAEWRSWVETTIQFKRMLEDGRTSDACTLLMFDAYSVRNIGAVLDASYGYGEQ